jgi:hypothetical protein
MSSYSSSCLSFLDLPLIFRLVVSTCRVVSRCLLARYTYWPPEISEDDINRDIDAAIGTRLGKSADFDFIWYENPKMTIPGIYHVQVFWCTK